MKTDGNWIKYQTHRLFFDLEERRYVIVGRVTAFADDKASIPGHKGADDVVMAVPDNFMSEDSLTVQYAIEKTPKDWNPSHARPEYDTEILLHAEYMERISSGRYQPKGRFSLTEQNVLNRQTSVR